MTRPDTRGACVALWLALLLPAAPVQGEVAGRTLLLQLDLRGDAASEGRECDLRFTMWSMEAGGEPVAEPVLSSTRASENGRVFVELDIDAGEAGGWLETGVRCPAGVGDFETIAPRARVSGPTLRVYP